MDKNEIKEFAKDSIPDFTQWNEHCQNQVIDAMSELFGSIISCADTGNTKFRIISEKLVGGDFICREDEAQSVLRMAYYMEKTWNREIVKSISVVDDDSFVCVGCGCILKNDYSLRSDGYCYLCDPEISTEELLSDEPF